jgi:hypothetical protein
MALRQHKRAVGVFSNRHEAEVALRELRDSNFAMDRVSVITQDADKQSDIAGADVRKDVREHSEGNKADEGATKGALAGGTVGGLTGLLVGLGTLAIPGIGPIMLAGATATAIATTLAGGAIGAVTGGLLGALVGLGIPEERARVYQDRISRGHYLILVEGTDEEISRAEAILRHRGIEEWGVYDHPDAAHAHTSAAATTTPRSALVHNKRAVGVFPHRRDAEAAITELRNAGFPMRQVSLVGKHANPNDQFGGLDASNRATGNQADEGAKTGAATGGILGGLGGLLVGLGALAIPGIGPVLAGGALATALATAAAGGAIGAAAGGLTGALVGLGIPDDRARGYNDRVNRGDYLVMVDGTEDEIRRAEAILRRHGIQDWEIFNVGDDDRYSHGYSTPDTHSHGSARGSRYRGVGLFPHRREAETALQELRNAGLPMDRVSVVGKNADHHDRIAGVEMSDRATGNKADEGAKAGAATGGILGGLGGLLVGLGALAIPGIGPVIAGGALATALATTAAGGAIGAAAGGITGALIGLGIPEERARFYNDRVNRGDYLVMVDGTEDELHRVQPILSRHGIQEWGIYDTRDVEAGRSHDTTPAHDRTHSSSVAADTHRPDSGRRHRAVGVFPHRRDAEAALRDLRDSGFSMNQISLVGKDTPGEPHVGNVADRTMTDEGAKTGAGTGAALGGLGGLLVGLGALAIPGIGPVLAGGALATALATTAAGGAIGAAAGGLTGALVGLGIPDDQAHFYNDRVNRGDYLVMVDGTEDEIRRADTILSRHGVQNWNIFDAPSGERHDSRTTTSPTATRNVIEPNPTPGVTKTHGDVKVVDDHPEVIIIDRRDQTL